MIVLLVHGVHADLKVLAHDSFAFSSDPLARESSLVLVLTRKKMVILTTL